MWACFAAGFLGLHLVAPVVLFAGDPTPADGWAESATLRLGAGAAGGYRQLDLAAAEAVAVLSPTGAPPTTLDEPFEEAGPALRVSVLGSEAGWWELELPVPPAPRADAAAWLEGCLNLVLRVRETDPSLEVGLVDGAVPRHSLRLPLNRFGPPGPGWTEYNLPLDQFAALAPELDLARLTQVTLFSASGRPQIVDLARAALHPGPRQARPVRVAHPARRPAAAVAGPAPRLTTGATDTLAPSPAPVALAPDSPGTTAPVGATPGTPLPGEAVGPTRPTTPAAPPQAPIAAPPPSVDPTLGPRVSPRPDPPAPTPEPARPAPAGPPPAAPPRTTGPVELPADLRPMLPVSFFFTDAPAGQTTWPASLVQAAWATNQGERAFDADDLAETFDLGPGGALPIETVADPERTGEALRLTVKQPGFAWWTCRLGRPRWELSDEQAYLRNGRLELAVKAGAEEEQFRLGVVDAADRVALVSIRDWATVGTHWQLVRVPLRALRTVNPEVDWSRLKAVVIASAHGRPLTLWIDDLRIVNPVTGDR